MGFFDSFKDPELCRVLLARLKEEVVERLCFMEVCGTHTVSIFQSGLRSLFPENIVHLTGPGCPVCVTHDSEVAAFLELAERDDVIIATFGDLMRVPGPKGANLKSAQADGARVEVIYSPFDAIGLAAENPDAKVVFLGVGFETTAPTVAATVRAAREQGLSNFFVMSFHKLAPPALKALLMDEETTIDGFILPGHVSAVIGVAPYAFIPKEFKVPAVVAGFEPVDILQALIAIGKFNRDKTPAVLNAYTRVVADEGNLKALDVMYDVFTPCDAPWRGIGVLPESGLRMSEAYADFDAFKAFDIELKDTPPPPGCRCGDVLKGKLRPDQCPLFDKACTPATPVGPCMVSTEGGCAAYHKYKLDL